MKVLFDTDIGSDIDDAVCLAYLLRQPRCELLGITTVTGDVQQRAALADAVCRAAGRADVPIVAGCRDGILRGVVQPEVPQARVLERFAHRAPAEFAPNNAVQFLREQIHAHPGEVTLLAVGPMTNIGLLFAGDPTVAAKLRRLVLMCGTFLDRPGRPHREWNALGDPIATAAVYHGKPPEHVSVGLDVTMECRSINSHECIARFRSIGGPLHVVAAMTEVWAAHAKEVTFHDPLAGALVFRPELCGYKDGAVNIDVSPGEQGGVTRFAEAAGGPHRIAASVDNVAFFDEYFRVMQG